MFPFHIKKKLGGEWKMQRSVRIGMKFDLIIEGFLRG
jgi:hypothetical protein